MKYEDWLKVSETSERIDSTIAILGTYTESIIDQNQEIADKINNINIILESLKNDTSFLKENIQKITVN